MEKPPWKLLWEERDGQSIWGISTKSFSSLHSIKITTSTPKGGESTCIEERKVFWKLQKSSENYESYGIPVSTTILPKESHYFNNCSTRTVWTLQKAHCIMPPQRMHKHTHRTQSATALTSESSSSLPLIPAKHLLSLQASQATWYRHLCTSAPDRHQLVWTRPQEGTSSEEASDLRTNTQVSPPSVPASPRWRRSHPEGTPGRWSRPARPRPQGCAWPRAGPHGAGPSRPVCASSGARASCGRSSASCHCGTKRKRGQWSPIINSQTNGVV